MQNKRISPVAVPLIKEALCAIYWYKSDLKTFLHTAISSAPILGKINWDGYKRQISSDVIDELISDQEKYLPALTRLVQSICEMKDFSHLEKLEDGVKKAKAAKDVVKALKEILSTHTESNKEKDEIEKRRAEYQEKLKKSGAVRVKLDEIKHEYFKAVVCPPQERGYKLEKILYEIFKLFDLDPRAAFKVVGEQIDGAFSLEGTDYLLEAKWQDKPCDIADLDAFAGKVRRRLDNTLGLMLSVNTFTEQSIEAFTKDRSVLLLMTGADLMAVLEERVDFTSLLLRKRRHASQTGVILIEFSKM